MTVTTAPRIVRFNERTIVAHSSNISEVYWAKDSDYAAIGSLYVVFHGGRVAGYRSVPFNEYLNLVNASSVGGYYARRIRGKFTGRDGNVTFAKAVETPANSLTTWSDALSVSSDTAMSVTSGTKPLLGNNKQKFRVTYTTTVELYADDFGDAERQVLTDGSNAKVKKVQKV